MTLAPFLTLFVGVHPLGRWQRRAIGVLVGLGLVVQVLGVSVDHQRFFAQRSYRAFFWYETPNVYWQDSQLFARPGELYSVLFEPFPAPPVAFRPGPYADTLPTYCMFGIRADSWMRDYAAFHLPRPWPLWVPALPSAIRPVDPTVTTNVCLLFACLGAFFLLAGMRSPSEPVGRGRASRRSSSGGSANEEPRCNSDSAVSNPGATSHAPRTE
jgi:hypothetical protein